MRTKTNICVKCGGVKDYDIDMHCVKCFNEINNIGDRQNSKTGITQSDTKEGYYDQQSESNKM